MSLTFGEAKDRIVIAVFGALCSAFIFLFMQVMNKPDKQEVIEIVMLNSPYAQDKGALQTKMQQLYENQGNLSSNLSDIKRDLDIMKLRIERLITIIDSRLESSYNRKESNSENKN